MIVLASTSRYRKALLERLGIPFEVDFPDCDERKLEAVGGHSGEIALRLAHAKAASVRARRRTDLVIGSDQFVVCDGQILHKPITAERACEQLAQLSGRTHELVTGVVLLGPSGFDTAHVDVTRLRMRSLEPEAIARYVEREQPFDCCGSYRVERLGITLFESVEGEDFTAIEGLPLIAVSRMLRKAGVQLP